MLQVEPLTKEQKREFYSQYTKEELIEFLIQREEAIDLLSVMNEYSSKNTQASMELKNDVMDVRILNLPLFTINKKRR